MTSESKQIISWLVCCRVVHSHGMLRLGIQGLTLKGNCWIVYNIGFRSQDEKQVRTTGTGRLMMEVGFGVGFLQEL